jgi:predicted dienelactone hydrolase
MRRLSLSLLACGLAAWSASAGAEDLLPNDPYPAGMTWVEYQNPADGRPLDALLIYPAAPDPDATPAKILFSTNLTLYADAPPADDGVRHPLVVFSHGAGGNGAGYAWFGEHLAERGYIVLMVYHYRANTYDRSALYVRNRLWQRPHDIGLDITHLLGDEAWGPRIDPDQIGVAGHSQGGFTALWMGGAEVDPDAFLAFQRHWKETFVVPPYLRAEMDLDAGPALDVRDKRVKAAFAMAPGDVQGFGMTAAGLGRMAIPAYIVVGEGDTTTPPAENAAFAAEHIPGAVLDILRGPVGHEIFGNECDRIGRDNFPAACVDAQGVDRALLHDRIGDAALAFFDAKLGVQRQE